MHSVEGKGWQEKESHFQYLLHCFFNKNDRPFPPHDLQHCTQSMGLDAFHSTRALCHKKVFVPGGAIESIFCPHRGYYFNNPMMPNMHIRKHYKAGLYLPMGCNTICNSADAMSKHGSSAHRFGKVSGSTPSKMK